MNNIRRQAPYWNMARLAGYINNRAAWRADLDPLDKIRLLIPHEKFTSSNLTKLNSNPPYVEFRAMGNENYHGRWEEVKATVLNYAEVIEAACVPDIQREQYELETNRLMRMVDRVRAIETERHAVVIERERLAEIARIAPLVERDQRRDGLRAARVAFVRARAQRLATEAVEQGNIALQDLDNSLMTVRQIRDIINSNATIAAE
jgi:hypothetical protein